MGSIRDALASRIRHWPPVDWVLAIYTGAIAVLIAATAPAVPEWRSLLAAHAAIVAVLVLLPPRGASWEKTPPGEPRARRWLRKTARFLRYVYPLPLVIFFFEEVQYTVHAVFPGYWFEPYLYAADRWLFGAIPAVALSRIGYPVLDEIMHFFYFSYYFILIGGVVIAWMGPPGERAPGSGFETTITSLALGFFLSFIWYPWLPARGPWENPALMAPLRDFEGLVFVPIIETIIQHGAVSGGCFPSSHVSGSWAIVLGLWRKHPRAARLLGILAVGMSFSCVYTRYHHAVDVPAGVLMGLLGGWWGRRLTRR